MPIAYGDLGMFTARFLAGATPDALDLPEILAMLQGASRRVDQFCHRSFAAVTQTRVFDGIGVPRRNEYYLAYANRNWPSYGLPNGMWLPDLLAASQVAIDQDNDRTYELVLSPSTDYYLLQDGADDDTLPPYNRFQLDASNPQCRYTAFASQPRLLQIQGIWGYTQETEAVLGATGTAITGTLTDATTTLLATSAATTLALGQTLLLDSEQVFVRGGSGTTWQVRRGVNGTTAASHATVALSRFVYVDEVREATLATAARMWARRVTAYSNVISNPNTGEILVFRGLDPDVEDMLSAHRRMVL